MQPINDWDNIVASNGGSMLQEGGYCCRIERVSDHTADSKPYIGIVFNPYVNGEFFFGGDAQDWQHEFRIYVSNGYGRYKMLCECCENSEGNSGFKYNANIPNHEQQLVGKWVGFVIRHRLYTKKQGKNAGKDGNSLDLQHICTTQAITAGDFPAPETKDDRDKAAAAPVSNAEIADYDLPF